MWSTEVHFEPRLKQMPWRFVSCLIGQEQLSKNFLATLDFAQNTETWIQNTLKFKEILDHE